MKKLNALNFHKILLKKFKKMKEFQKFTKKLAENFSENNYFLTFLAFYEKNNPLNVFKNSKLHLKVFPKSAKIVVKAKFSNRKEVQ